MPTEIISRRDGIRRGGVAHHGTRVWPDGTFTADQLAQLCAEPLLVVRDVAGDETAGEDETKTGKPRR